MMPPAEAGLIVLIASSAAVGLGLIGAYFIAGKVQARNKNKTP